MNLALVIVAAGSGSRMKLGINKIFKSLNYNADEWVCSEKSTHFLKNTKKEDQKKTPPSQDAPKKVPVSQEAQESSELLKENRTIIEVTLSKFLEIQEHSKYKLSEILITYRQEDYEEMKGLLERFAQQNSHLVKKCNINLILGGNTRCLSVHHALMKLGKDITHVLVHDGARPFVSFELYERLVENLKQNRVSIPAIKLTDTIRKFDQSVLGTTLDRNVLCAIQTPQCYDVAIAKGITDYIENLKVQYGSKYEEKLSDITDDSSLIARVFPEIEQNMIEGSKFNIKITTPDDMEFAKMFYSYLGSTVV